MSEVIARLSVIECFLKFLLLVAKTIVSISEQLSEICLGFGVSSSYSKQPLKCQLSYHTYSSFKSSTRRDEQYASSFLFSLTNFSSCPMILPEAVSALINIGVHCLGSFQLGLRLIKCYFWISSCLLLENWPKYRWNKLCFCEISLLKKGDSANQLVI